MVAFYPFPGISRMWCICVCMKAGKYVRNQALNVLRFPRIADIGASETGPHVVSCLSLRENGPDDVEQEGGCCLDGQDDYSHQI